MIFFYIKKLYTSKEYFSINFMVKKKEDNGIQKYISGISLSNSKRLHNEIFGTKIKTKMIILRVAITCNSLICYDII